MNKYGMMIGAVIFVLMVFAPASFADGGNCGMCSADADCGECHVCADGSCVVAPHGKDCGQGDPCQDFHQCDYEGNCKTHDKKCGGDACNPSSCVDGECVSQPIECGDRADGGGSMTCCAGKCFPEVPSEKEDCGDLPGESSSADDWEQYWLCDCQYQAEHCISTESCSWVITQMGGFPSYCTCDDGGGCTSDADCGDDPQAVDCQIHRCVGAGTDDAHCFGAEDDEMTNKPDGAHCNSDIYYDDPDLPGECGDGLCVQRCHNSG